MDVTLPNDQLMRRKMSSIIKGTDVRFRLVSESSEEFKFELLGDTSQIADRLQEM